MCYVCMYVLNIGVNIDLSMLLLQFPISLNFKFLLSSINKIPAIFYISENNNLKNNLLDCLMIKTIKNDK